jgi:hypothetical protein
MIRSQGSKVRICHSPSRPVLIKGTHSIYLTPHWVVSYAKGVGVIQVVTVAEVAVIVIVWATTVTGANGPMLKRDR